MAAMVSLLIHLVASASAEELRVMASIKPVHSLVAGVMSGIGMPGLIVAGGGSPHGYALKPSEARAIERADVIFWIDQALETFLTSAIDGLAGDARVVALAAAPGIELLARRDGGVRVADSRDDLDDDHDRNADGLDHGRYNLHVWLDPTNARAMVGLIVATLVEADPGNRVGYEKNGEELSAKLAALEAEIAGRLEPVRDKPFIVFHDAYQYLEHRFGLAAVGSIALSPEIQPGAARLSELRRLVGERGAVCVFSEPQFEPRHVALVIEGATARNAVLDPLGADIEPGPDLYFDLMRRNADAIERCLSGTR